MLQHIYKTSVCTESKNIGQLSMYASCVQLPTTVVGILACQEISRVSHQSRSQVSVK